MWDAHIRYVGQMLTIYCLVLNAKGHNRLGGGKSIPPKFPVIWKQINV